MMLRPAAFVALSIPLLAHTAIAADRGSRGPIRVNLTGGQEDPTVITDARGATVLRVQGNTVAYTLRYRGLSDLQQAHIHIGAADTTGGIAAFLCTNLGNGPAGTPSCPPAPAQVAGVIDAADVVGPADQGVQPGAIASLIVALRQGLAYVNLHTAAFPRGEIRGDLPPHDRHD